MILCLDQLSTFFVMLLKIYSCFHGDYFELACSVGFVGGGFGFPEDGFEFVNEWHSCVDFGLGRVRDYYICICII